MPCFPTGFPPVLVGDPVDTLTGALTEKKLEFRLIGPLELSWWRHYDSSQAGHRFALGWGHTHDLDRILFVGDERIVYGHPVGQQVWFPLLPDDGAEAMAQGYTLQRRSRTSYELRRHAEPSVEFVFAPGARRARPARLFDTRGEIRLFHDARNRLERIVHSTGAVLHLASTEAGLLAELMLERAGAAPEPILTYTYDERGNLVGTRDYQGHGYAFTYDAANRMLLRRGRKGFRFRYRYDDKGRCVFSAGDDNWYGVALTYDKAGRITQVRKPDGGLWTYKFMPGGRLSEILDPLGGVQKFLYDAEGRATHEVDPLGNVTEYVFDAAGAPVRKVLPTGHVVPFPDDPNAADPRLVRIAANAAEYQFGRLLTLPTIGPPRPSDLAALELPSASLALAQAAGPVTSAEMPFVVPPVGRAWWPEPARGRVFNPLGKLLRQVDDAGRVRQWEYDASGNRETYRDFDGGEWRYEYGAWHLLRGLTTPTGARTTYTYTTNERIASCRDAGETLSEYAYDQVDRLVEVRRHGVVRESYVHDAAGNLIAKHGADGRRLVSCEIAPGNLAKRLDLESGDRIDFVRDAAGRCTLATTRACAVARSYDERGRLTADQRDGSGFEFVSRGVNAATDATWFGHFSAVIAPLAGGGFEVRDPTGGRHIVRLPGFGFASGEFANGTRETSQFDDRGRLLLREVRRRNGTIWSRRYEWSGEGELTRINDSQFGEIRHAYDAAHRLSGRMLQGRVERVYFDLADNLLEKPGLSGVVLRDGNRLLEANGIRFEYNDRNHVALTHGPDGTTEYAYDSLDRLVRVAGHAGVWTAEYDALGRRTRKTWRGSTTEFHWFGQQLVAETSPDRRLRLYVYPDDLALTPMLLVDYDDAEAAPRSGRVGVVFSDQVGAPVLVEGPQGETLWQGHLAPFGEVDVAPGSTIALNLRFPGHYADPELDLHCNGFRYYSPVFGRYLQSDPLGIAGGTNLYAYRTNPLLKVDVRGLGEDPHAAKEDDPNALKEKTGEVAKAGDGDGWPPPRTKEATDESKHVADTADKVLGKKKSPVVDVLTHEDGTVSVGISGKPGDPGTVDRAQRLENALNKGVDKNEFPNGKYKVSGDSTVPGVETIPGGNPAGNCAEPKAATAAKDNPSPITGHDTRWRSDAPNPYPFGGPNAEGQPVSPQQMGPCKTCADPANNNAYGDHAHGDHS